jgi:hypothetical protein
MALLTTYLGRKSLARGLAADARRTTSLAGSMMRRVSRILRITFETAGEAQDLRRSLIRKYPFSDA